MDHPDSAVHSTLNSLDCWDYSIELECIKGNTDLQLAAELGKTLLERNKELEAAIKHLQAVNDDQVQEIEYLQKQTRALREAGESRMRIYEQLEASIQELERQNHRLQVEGAGHRRRAAALQAQVEALEARSDDLQARNDELTLQLDVYKRRAQRPPDINLETEHPAKEKIILRHVETKDNRNEPVSPDSTSQRETNKESSIPTPLGCDQDSSFISSISTESHSILNTSCLSEELDADSGMEQMVSQVLSQLRESRAQCGRNERKVAELEEQLSALIQQNQALEDQVIQLSHRDEDLSMRSMHDELTTLDEVKQGQMCMRCLRTMECDTDDVEGSSDVAGSGVSTGALSTQDQASIENQSVIQTKPSNPYKELVEKYEALVEVHRSSKTPKAPLSLQEELQMLSKDTDEDSCQGDSLQMENQHKKTRKLFSTPTDFSEAETNSSGFADETSNKGTQTEGRVGSFLCTIADGEDCKFSIYDDASPIDSRFRDRPEYRILFKEIFKVLKKAAENKEEGDDLPLLDDLTATKMPNVPPVTPLVEQFPEIIDDDSQSVVSSTMSELSINQNEPTTIIENIIEAQNQPIPEGTEQSGSKAQCVLRPLVRQPLEYMEGRKRSSSRRKNRLADRSDSPVTHIIGSPKISYSSRPNSGRRRREQRANQQVAPAAVDNNGQWNGNTLQFWSSNRNLASPTPSQGSGKGYFEFKPSTASQDLHKLRKLDLSYAEVLRNADNKKREMLRYRRK